MVAMAGMYLAGNSTFSSFATGTILVVAVAVIGSLTVLPALLSKLGDRVDKGRVPFLRRMKRGTGESRVWSAVLDRVLRRPLVSALAATALMLALAAPVLGMKTALPGLDTFPRELEVMQTYDRIQAAFPGDQIPADVVVQADDVRSDEVLAAATELERRTATQRPARPAEHRGEPRRDAGEHLDPDRRRRHRRPLQRSAGRAAGRDRPRHLRPARGGPGRRDRHHRRHARTSTRPPTRACRGCSRSS